jgi:hypothetical protein
LAKTLQRLTIAFNFARREDVAGPPARLSFSLVVAQDIGQGYDTLLQVLVTVPVRVASS